MPGHSPPRVEKVRVGADSGKQQVATLDTVEQQPVRLDVQVAEALPVALERMIP